MQAKLYKARHDMRPAEAKLAGYCINFLKRLIWEREADSHYFICHNCYSVICESWSQEVS